MLEISLPLPPNYLHLPKNSDVEQLIKDLNNGEMILNFTGHDCGKHVLGHVYFNEAFFNVVVSEVDYKKHWNINERKETVKFKRFTG